MGISTNLADTWKTRGLALLRMSSLLHAYGLNHNPFVDRTAEKTELEDASLYMHSDLQHFKPTATTYLFFGRRGAGKTTIRLKMQSAYHAHNARVEAAATTATADRPFFIVDLCSPSHLTTALNTFASHAEVGADPAAWDAKFSEAWTSGDFIDTILSFAATDLVGRLLAPSTDDGGGGEPLLARLRKAPPRFAVQLLLLTHLYARADAASLTALRAALLPIALRAQAGHVFFPSRLSSGWHPDLSGQLV